MVFWAHCKFKFRDRTYTRSLERKMQIEHNVKHVLTQNMKPPNRGASFSSMLYHSLQPTLSVGTELLRVIGVKFGF
jgi:hypothetical protein